MSLNNGVFSYDRADLEESSEPWSSTSFTLSNFDRELRKKWDQAQEDGHFRYKLDIEDTKIFGDNKYIAQLNVKRATERRKPDTIMSVSQPFTPHSFNFTKIRREEILFELVKNCDTNDPGPMVNGCQEECGLENNKDANSERSHKNQVQNLVVINVSPLEYGHILLIPDINACRPQVLTKEALELAFEILLLSRHRGFKVGFNSLCAFASVNHQHLHAFYLDQELYSESATVDHIQGCLYEFVALPTKGFAFQLHGSTVDKLSSLLFEIADYFVRNEIAHNLYMTRGPVFGEQRNSTHRTVRVYFWPRKKVVGVKDEAAFNVAIVELAGHLPIKIREMFGNLNEEYIDSTIQEAALEEMDYNRVKQDVIKMCDSYS